MIEPWHSVWAKTDRDSRNPGVITAWLPLHQHLADTAGIAGLLVDEWVSPQVVRRIAADIGGDHSDVRTIASWLAAVHDVGKISPAFTVQAYKGAPVLLDLMRHNRLAVQRGAADDSDRSKVRHEFVGQNTVSDWLSDELGFVRERSAAQFACVVGGHHGVPATSADLALVLDRPDLAGGKTWAVARASALAWATELTGGRTVLAPYAGAILSTPSQALLTAIVIMADWIASNAELFPLDPLYTADEPVRVPDTELTRTRVARGWAQVDFPKRWAPSRFGDVRGAFLERFGREPRPIQIAAVSVAKDRPGMVIVEAPMGEGKTEAAFLAAEALAAQSGADGCFVALPTRATTDAMFERVLIWLRILPGRDTVSVTLAHGTAALNDKYLGLLSNAHARDVGEDGDEAAIAHEWLRGRKKGPLAQFVVGTVDQILFAALKSRHLALRHLALAGKVVIIDEVHAYDVYMSRYLDRALHWLGAYGTPVVLLSATLPAARRAELLAAYDSGRNVDSTTVCDQSDYPVVVASGRPPLPASASGVPRTIMLDRLIEDPALADLDSLVAALRDRLHDGGCAVVIRNTVGRVQQTADRLIAEFGDEHVTISHSRFLACDRAERDKGLLRRFGPPGSKTERPTLHVVVASQVVEQSLDIDFDLMVTDLAPIDLLLQRMGRLHRHSRTRPQRVAQPCCMLTGVEDWNTEPIRDGRGSRAVYSEHALPRAAALLVGRADITLPTDIASLVQVGYSDNMIGPESWQAAMATARERERREMLDRQTKAEEFLLDEVECSPAATLEGWVRAGAGDADDRGDTRRSGQVRDGAESLEVLVVQRDSDGGLLTPDWIRANAGVQLPTDEEVPRHLARTVATCALRLPMEMSQLNPVGDGVVAALERSHFTSFHQSALLKGQLVLVLDGERTAEIRGGPVEFRVTYDVRRGLLHERL